MTIAHTWLAGLSLDVRYVLRVLAASPLFTAVAVLSLGIAIGVNAVMFSVARFALLDPLPVEEPAELRVVEWSGPAKLQVSQYNSGGSTNPATGRAVRTNYNYRTARRLEDGASAAGVELFAFNFVSQLTVGIEGRPVVAAGGLMASGRYFPALRPRFLMGRGLARADDDPSAPNVAVIGHGFWLRAFGGDPAVLGKTMTVNGTPFAVVGVTDAAFRGLSSGSRFAPLTDVTVAAAKQPLVFAPEGAPLFDQDNRLWLRMMARVPGSTDEPAASRALSAVLRGALDSSSWLPPEAGAEIDLTFAPGARGIDSIARNARTPVTILAAVVGIVLLIACMNLASLSLARGVARQRELSVRRALGAARGRLVRQLLIESLVIATAGGLTGGLFALWTFPVAAAMVTSGFGAPAVALPLDWRTLLATAAVTGIAGLLFGLLPALALTRPETTAHLRQRVTGAVSPKLTVGRVLLAIQIAISVPLIVAAGLLLETVRHLSRVDLGFNADGLVLFRLEPAQAGLTVESSTGPSGGATVDTFVRDLIRNLESIPGVASATLLENALVSGWVSNNTITIDGERKSIHMNGVGPRYFETMQVPLRAGRAPTLEDTRATPRVTVINQTAARQLFGSDSPIGRRFTLGRSEVEVIGVAADSKYSALRADTVPTMFDPLLQRASAGGMYVAVRVKSQAVIAGLEPALRRAVADANPNLPITDLRTQHEQVDLSMGREHLLARLLGVFAAFALLLACLGLYGTTSYAVARRTNEIGIRVALGARRAQVLWLVLRQVLMLAAIGLALGMPAALATGPLVGSLLYGLGPRDPMTIAVASAIMLGVALLAGVVPARRAARLEVRQALRTE